MSTATEQAVVTIPALRFGNPYESLDTNVIRDLATGEPVARMGLVNPGIIRRDRRRAKEAAAALRRHSVEALIAISAKAGELFMHADLPLGDGDRVQSPDDYVGALSATSGLPHVMCRANMGKVHYVLTNMSTVLAGLTRHLDLSVLDRGIGDHHGSPVAFYPTTDALGAVLPSNSPGVNSIWLPAIALKTPLVIKPGSEEPWTPWRIIQAFMAAGAPREAFCFYPTTHEGAATIMEQCDRAIIFGDRKTVERYDGDARVEVHGPGWSKILLGEDVVDDWRQYLDVMVQSVLANGGRSCVNASAIVTPRHGDAIAEALAEVLGPVSPKTPEDPDAKLSATANPKMAAFIDETIEQGLSAGGARDVCAAHRDGPRRVQVDGRAYVRPSVIRCDDWSHPLANTEFMCPYVSVTELPQDQMLERIGPTLVATAITRDASWQRELLACPHIARLNLGPAPTTRVDWDQPHEGNLFETLYERRAVHRETGW